MISFCTAIKNRLRQFSQVFNRNIHVIKTTPETQWVILNFNSNDNLHEFIMSHINSLPINVKYIHDFTERPWHACIAKNMAHSFGDGEWLMNLDCDNYIADAAECINQYDDADLVHMWSEINGDGTYGRIAVKKNVFNTVGGYNEAFYPMAHQDVDLIARIRAIGFEIAHHIVDSDLAIPNDKNLSIANCKLGALTWKDYAEYNRAASAINLRLHRYVANQHEPYGRFKLADIYVGGNSNKIKTISNE